MYCAIATGLPVTPIFRSRYATDEENYRTVRLPASDGDYGPSTFALLASADRLSSDFPPPTSGSPQLRASSFELRRQAELLSGSRLDGTGGWKPLGLGEILERWNTLGGDQPYPANVRKQSKDHEDSKD